MILLKAKPIDFSVMSIVLTFIMVIGYLIYIYSNSANFKAFFRLPQVRVVLLGGFVLGLSFWVVNAFFNVPDQPAAFERQEESPSFEALNVPVDYSDVLYYQPQQFFPYLIQISRQLDSLKYGDVKRYLIEEEYKDLYVYWKTISLNRSELEDAREASIGHLYYAYFAFYEKHYEEAIAHFRKSDDTLAYKHYYAGLSYTSLKKYALADSAFRKEGRLKGSPVAKEAYIQLAQNYLDRKENCSFLQLAPLSEESQKLVPTWRIRLMRFECEGIVSYYQQAIEHYYGDVPWYAVCSSFFMSLLWMVYFYLLDLFKKDKRALLLAVFVLEMVFMILFLLPWLDLQDLWFGEKKYESLWMDFVFRIGLPEEGIKIVPLLCILLPFWKRFEEPYDILLLAVFSACGFAFMENMLYIGMYSHGVMSMRTIFSTLGHIVDTCIVTYGLVLLKFRPHPSRIFKLLWYFFLACFVHGLFDYLLMHDMFFLSLLLFFVGLTFVAITLNNCFNNSPQFTFSLWIRSMRLVEILVFGFIAIFIYEYVMLNFTMGTRFANNNLLGNMLLHSFLLFIVTTKLSNFDLVRGFWKEIYLFKVPQEFKARATFNPFLFVAQYFVANSIYPQNFIGLRIVLKAHFHYPALAELFQGTRRAMFADRIVVTEYEKKNVNEYTSFLSEKFFVVILNYPIAYQGFSSPVLLLRFRSNTVGLGSIPKQSVKLYFVDALEKIKQKEIDLREFPYLGMAVIGLDEEIKP